MGTPLWLCHHPRLCRLCPHRAHLSLRRHTRRHGAHHERRARRHLAGTDREYSPLVRHHKRPEQIRPRLDPEPAPQPYTRRFRCLCHLCRLQSRLPCDTRLPDEPLRQVPHRIQDPLCAGRRGERHHDSQHSPLRAQHDAIHSASTAGTHRRLP